jgi:hypothetical protein
MGAVVIAAFLPALDIFIAGDDFEWLERSYAVVGDPLSSFALVNRFLRPLVMWSYLADYLVFGQLAVGYMLTNLAIHLFNTVLVTVLLRRRLHSPLLAVWAAAVFALSPLHSEGVLWAAGRPETILLTCWLVSLVVLDRWCERPSAGLALAFTAAALLGIGAKESWIVFPFLAGAYAVLVHRVPVATALRRTSPLWLAWLIYVFGFLVIPALAGVPSATHYADFRVVPALLKTSITLLAYCSLGAVPVGSVAAIGLSLAVTVGTALWLVRTGNRFGLWALLWLAATLLLVAPFPVSVLRHNYLPLAGFWMVVAAVVDRSLAAPRDRATETASRIATRVTTVAAAAILVVEAGALQREIADYRLYGDLHRRLCRTYRAAQSEIPHDRPLVLVDRGSFRGVEFVASRVQGCAKTFYVRRDALWQLVFLPPLANFLGNPFEHRLEPVSGPVSDLFEGGFTVLFLDDDGFELRPDLEGGLLEAVAATGELPPGVGVYRFKVV